MTLSAIWNLSAAALVTNHILNPSLEGPGGLAPDWTQTPGAAAFTNIRNVSDISPYSQRVQYTGAVGDSNATIYPLISIPEANGFAAPGEIWTGAIKLKGSASGLDVAIIVRFLNSAKTTLGGAAVTTVTLTNTWQEIVQTSAAAPANTRYVRLEVRSALVHSGDTLDLYADNAYLVKAGRALAAYPDPLALGAHFTGAWNNSTSIKDLVYPSGGKWVVEDTGNAPGTIFYSPAVAVTGGQVYGAGGLIEVTALTGGEFLVDLCWYDADDAYLSGGTIGDFTAITAEAWRELTFKAPTYATQARLRLSWTVATGKCIATVRDACLRELPRTPVLASCPFSFLCEPYACGPELIVFDQAVTVPNFSDFFVPGDYKTPLSISWTPSGARTGHIDRFAMGLLPDQTTPLSALLRPATWGAVTVYASVGGLGAVCVTAGNHGLFNGQHVRINAATTPAVNSADWAVEVINANSFRIPVAVTTGASGQWSPWSAYFVGAVSDAHAYGGIYMPLSANSWSYWEINDTALPRGSYLPFLRVGKTTTGAVPRVKLSQTGDDESVFTWAGTNYDFRTWPRSVAAPAAVVHGAGVSYFSIGVNAGAAGGAAQFDYLALVPTSWGWTTSMGQFTGNSFELDYDGTAYIGASTALAGGVRTGGMPAVGAQRLFFISADAAYGQISGQLLIKVIPRYNLWR